MQKKVFISYSWGSKEHQDWIVNLGTRLMNDTVDVVLDRWSLKEGHDIHSFMEEMVKADDIFRVLIVCDAKYKEKADDRTGGVGTETQIITPSIYSNQKQEKFIPIVLERDENGNPFLPIYLANRKYIDFSREENFEDSYEELLRNILEAPAIPKPKLGNSVPHYITENLINLSETNNQLRTLENQLKKGQKVSPKYLHHFIETFLDKLWEFRLHGNARDIKTYGNNLFEKLKAFKPLREDFIKFADIASGSETEFDTEVLIEFFENEPRYQRPRETVGGWNGADFDIFKIIFQELFLYTIAISLRNKNYLLVTDLLHSKYYSKDEYAREQNPKRYTFLYQYHQNLESYITTVYNKVTGFGDYVITNLSEQLSKEDLILGDTLCYFVSYLKAVNIYDTWFPSTYVYLDRGKLSFFDKVSSQKHFEKVKAIFGVDNVNELKELLLKIKATEPKEINYGRLSYSRVPFVFELVDPETIGIYR